MVIKVKHNGEWVKIPYLSYENIQDAPSDGNQYVRQDGEWSVVNIPDQFPEAPIDNKQYARKNGDWSEVVIPEVEIPEMTWENVANKPSWIGSSKPTYTVNEISNAVATNDSRLSDARTPLAHTHTKSNITDFAHQHFKADITDFAHSHAISDITNLSTTLDKKVDAVTGKGLSTNDYTTAEKTKLSGIAEGAEVNVNADWNATTGDAQILNKPALKAVATSGDYNDLSNKPTIPAAQVQTNWNATSGISSIANKPNLAAVATSGSYNDLSNKPTIPTVDVTKKYVDDELANKADKSDIASVYKVKGSVANYAALPTTNVAVGDVYNLIDTGANYVATSTVPEWDKLSETVDLSGYQPKGDYVLTTDSRLTNARPANGGNADTVNNHSVNADVPADAKFTDTVYNDSVLEDRYLKKGGDRAIGLYVLGDRNEKNSTTRLDIESFEDDMLHLYRTSADGEPSAGPNKISFYNGDSKIASIGTETNRNPFSTSFWVAVEDIKNNNKLTLGSSGLQFNEKKVWHEENDGSDSGLDADLLDGKHASEFQLANTAISTVINSVTTLTNLPTDKYGIKATVSGNTAISFASTPPEGSEYMIDILSPTAFTQAIPNAGEWQSDEASIDVEANKVTSISIRYIHGKYVVRV